MALTTPINLTQRGLTAKAGVLTTLYPHSQEVNDGGLKVVSAVFNGADAATVMGTAVAPGDLFNLINIPAGAFVLTVNYKVTTTEAANTFIIGDTAQDDGYCTVGVGIGSAATDGSSFNGTTTPHYGVGKYYAAADTINLTIGAGTAAKVVIKVSATYIQTAPLTN